MFTYYLLIYILVLLLILSTNVSAVYTTINIYKIKTHLEDKKSNLFLFDKFD